MPRLPDTTTTKRYCCLVPRGSETPKAAGVADAETAAHIGNDSAAVRETGKLSRAQGGWRESSLGYRIRAGGSRGIGVECRTPCGHARCESRSSRQQSGVVAATTHRRRCKQLDNDGSWIATGKWVDDKVALGGQGHQAVGCYRAGTAGNDFFARIVDIHVDADRAGNRSTRAESETRAARASVCDINHRISNCQVRCIFDLIWTICGDRVLSIRGYGSHSRKK